MKLQHFLVLFPRFFLTTYNLKLLFRWQMGTNSYVAALSLLQINTYESGGHLYSYQFW